MVRFRVLQCKPAGMAAPKTMEARPRSSGCEAEEREKETIVKIGASFSPSGCRCMVRYCQSRAPRVGSSLLLQFDGRQNVGSSLSIRASHVLARQCLSSVLIRLIRVPCDCYF